MPITIYPTTLKYKNSQGTFQSATALKGDSGEAIIEQVNGTTPTITCEANHRYICNEVLALNITPSADGVCEIIFTSGNNATALTAPSTIKWPEWFSPDALEPNATYSLKISNNLANVAIWPEEGLTGDTRMRIQKMLGIYQAPWELIREDTVTNETEADIDITVDGNGQAFELTDVRMEFCSPNQQTQFIKGDYGRISFYFSNNSADHAFIGAYTQNANANARYAFACIEQNDDMVIKTYTQNGGSGDSSPLRVYSQPNGAFFKPANARIYTRVLITKVTGTSYYKLYGKRKWN